MLFRLLFFAAFIYCAYLLLTWVGAQLSDTYPCHRCDGKGYWDGIREREYCRDCKGTGRLPKRG